MRAEYIYDEDDYWHYYSSIEGEKLFYNKSDNVGKFMTFGKGEIPNEIRRSIMRWVGSGTNPAVKHTNPNTDVLNPYAIGDSWVIVWYSTDEKESLEELASFLVQNKLVPQTKSGKYYNISFKYNNQTRNGQYGEDFKAAIKFEDLIDLNTGQLLKEKKEEE